MFKSTKRETWYAQLLMRTTMQLAKYIKYMYRQLTNVPCLHHYLWPWDAYMMTSSKGNISALLAMCARNSPVSSPHKGQWRGALMFSLICAWINRWVNDREAGYLKRYRVYYEATVLKTLSYIGVFKILTFWGRDKNAAISQTFLNAFSLIQMYEFRWFFHWSLFLRV